MLLKATYTIKDRKGKLSKVQAYLQDTPENEDMTSYAYLVNGFQELARKINAVILGQIVDISVSYHVPLPIGLRVFPALNSDVEEGAIFQFRNNRGLVFSCRLPSFNEDFVEADGTINTTNEVADFAYFLTRPDENGFYDFRSARDEVFTEAGLKITENFKRR